MAKFRILVLVVSISIAISSIALGCAMLFPSTKFDDGSPEHEKAIIVWNSKSKIQHFIRKSTFNTKGESFGFIVPVPSKPTLSETQEEIFSHVEKEIRVRNVVIPFGFWTWEIASAFVDKFTYSEGMIGRNIRNFDIDGAPDSLSVIEERDVAGFKATVLQAKNTKVLLEWLSDNEFLSRPEFEQWLDYYVRNDWYIVAFKYDASQNSESLAPVISFKSERPFYPFREPQQLEEFKDTGINRSLRISIISDKPVSWIEDYGTAFIPEYRSVTFSDYLSNFIDDIDQWKSPLWLTSMKEHRRSPRPDMDIYFEGKSFAFPYIRLDWSTSPIIPIEGIALLFYLYNRRKKKNSLMQ